MVGVVLALMLLGILAGASWYIWDTYRTFQTIQNVDFRILELGGLIHRHDEALRIAARMAAATGDPAWEGRYRAARPVLETVVEEARGLTPEVFTGKAVTRAQAAGDALRVLEERVFDLVRAGDQAAAAAVVAGAAYEAQSQVHAEAIGALAGALRDRAEATLAAGHERAFRDAALAVAAICILLALCYVVLRMLIRSINDGARSAEELRRQRDFAESLVENAPVIVLLLDPRGRILRFNPYLAELSGFRLKEVRGRDWFQVFLPERASARARRLVLHRDTESERRGYVFPIVTRGGGEREIEWYDKRLIDGSGAVVGVLAIGQDISERKQAEAQRLAREAAERANLAKSKFLAAASHDLRQPLQAMRMFVAALARRTRHKQSREIVRHIEDSMEATDSLLSALLDISKLDADMLKPEIADFPIDDLLGRLAAEFEPLAANGGVELRVVGSKATVKSDPVLLDRILRNLVANAVRYTAKGRVLIGCRRQANRLRVEVWDTGPGIPKNQLQAIFEEFHQLGNPERDRTRGLGLGLAIVDRMSRLLGHRVAVTSTVGKGSAFSVEVPCEVPCADEPRARAEPVPTTDDIAGAVVIVIDDERSQLTGLKLVLEGWGCRVLAATGVEGALRQLDGKPPDLVLADFRLRDNVTGAAVIRRIREHVDAPVPAVILTGDTEPARLREARLSDCALLHKPIDPRKLQAAISRILQRRRAGEGATR